MDSFQRPFRFLPSLKKKTVIILYNVVIWALIVLITITAIGVTTYDQIKIIHWVTYLAGALLVPLFGIAIHVNCRRKKREVQSYRLSFHLEY